jgi:hypothetical protein
MPGTPDPVLGSDALTFGVAVTVAALVAVLPFVFRKRLRAARRLALGGGLAYAALCLGAWAGARFVADAFIPSMVEQIDTLVVLLLWSTVVLGAQAAAPAYLYARWNLRTPLLGLFALTALVLYAFFRVRGESDPLALYVLFFGPILVGGLLVLGAVEAGVRRLIGRVRG